MDKHGSYDENTVNVRAAKMIVLMQYEWKCFSIPSGMCCQGQVKKYVDKIVNVLNGL